MIQRLVGGHLHHSVYRKVENDFPSQSPNRLSKLYYRRKPVATTTASLFTSTQPTSTIASTLSLTTTAEAQTEATSKVKTKPNENVFIVQAEKYDDATSAYEANQVINYKATRDRFVESGAGEGKDESGAKKQDDSKKTLADQVADGKYALIQDELFSKKPKRPGIISYLPNPEVPNDTADNLGGLSSDDIWLAEDHLLVLKGGSLNSANDKEPWKPIDDYEAPPRQVKIPDNPKVPPPFLVQLEENGPLQFIGDNKLPLINPFTNESLLLFHENGFPKTETYSRDKANLYARPGAPNVAPFNSTAIYGSGGGGSLGNNNFTFSNPFLSPRPEHIPGGFVGPPPPFGPPFGPYPFMPNGSLENSNFTDFIDEEDPSFYYPPPYSFVYKPNYTNPVEPGPLVPGIILPPPPNFFGRLTSTRKGATNGTSTSRPFKQILRPVVSRPTTSTSTTSTTTVLPITYKTVSWKNTRPSKAYVSNLIHSTTPVSTTTTARLPIVKVTQLKKVVGPETLAFVSKDAIGLDPLIAGKGKPIYYEYFDAREKSRPITTTPRSPTTQAYPRPYNAYLPIKPSNYEKYSHNSPKPKDPTSINVVKLEDYRNDALLATTPEKAFTSEIENIRHTIDFFKSQQQQNAATTQVPSPTVVAFPTRNPKTKGIFDYSYDRVPMKTSNDKAFAPPTEFDSTPFKPMVHYSPPLNANNGFKGIPYTTVPTVSSAAVASSSTTTTEAPFTSFFVNDKFASKPYSGRVQYIPIDTSVLRSLPITTKDPYNQYYKTLPVEKNVDSIHSNLKYSTARPLIGSQPVSTVQPWLSIEKQVLREVQPKEINVQIQSHTPTVGTNTAPYESAYVDAKSVIPHPVDTFYYRQPPPYSISFQHQTATHPTLSPVKSAQQNAYLRQIEMLRQEIERYPNQYHVQVANTSRPFVNYRQARPLGHPNPNIISSYRWEANRFPQLSDVISPNYGAGGTNQQQRLPAPQVQTLHKDIYVNYKYPLPPIDPDSEFLPPILPPVPPPFPQPTYYSRYGRLNRAPSVVRYKLPGDQQAGVYFYHESKRRNTDAETKN